MIHSEDLSSIKSERARGAKRALLPWNETVKGYESKMGKDVRRSTYASVIADLDRTEHDEGGRGTLELATGRLDVLDPGDFTVNTLPPRFAKAGDLWAKGMKKSNKLEKLLK